MIEVSHLTKRYGDKYAVNDISFHVNEGEILGFLGPNGAGKSTTMNIITGYLSSNTGKVTVAGIDMLENPTEAKKHIGFLPEQPPLYLDMTVRDYLNFAYDLKGCKLNRKAHVEEICGLVKISGVYNRIIKNLSKGYRQRVGIAQALIGNPDVLILDEPTVGLDPKQIIEIRGLIKNLGKKHTIILSSHILPEVQSVCERIIIINRGLIVADDTAVNLSNQLSKDHKVVVRAMGPEDTMVRAISGISGVKNVMSLGSREEGSFDIRIETETDKDIRRPLFNLLSDRRWTILKLDSGEMTLEDIFLRLTSEDNFQRVRSAKRREIAAEAKKAREEAEKSKEEEAAVEAGEEAEPAETEAEPEAPAQEAAPAAQAAPDAGEQPKKEDEKA